MTRERIYDPCSHRSGCREKATGRDEKDRPMCAEHLKGLTLTITMLGYEERPTYSIGLGDDALPKKTGRAA